jgi:predicted lipoprotein with Yx(FWY)xxD motif
MNCRLNASMASKGLLLAAGAALAIIAPVGAASGAGGNASSTVGKSERPTPGTTIKTLQSQFGKVLFSKSNRAIYYFDKETGRTPECYGACAQAWPPVLTKGRPQADGAARAGLLGTTKRANGRKQVTYDDHPLYYYAHDPRGEVLCHDIEEFGGLWLAVKPNGGSPPVS